MTLAVGVLLLLSVAHYAVVTRIQGWASAEATAVVSMLVMTAGLVYYREEHSAPFIEFSVLCYSACIIGMMVFALVRRPRARRARVLPPELLKPTAGMWLALIVCVAITIAYFVAAGSVPFLAGVQNVLGQAENNVRDLRAETYQGASYLAPGYVNQVKNVLLPALTAITAPWLWRRGGLARRSLSVVLVLWAVIALFGTGQRTFSVVFFAALLGSYSMVRGGVPRGVLLKAGGVFILLFALATAALGRSEEEARQAEGFTGVAGVYLTEVVERFLYGQQASALMAEDVVRDWQIPFLSDWKTTTLGYLPGRSESTSVAGEVGRYYTGSDASTMPPSSVTSARLNLGAAGAIVFFFLWGVFLAALTRWVLRTSGGSPFFFMGSSGLMFVLGAWVSDAPIAQMQWGAPMFAVLMLLGRHQYNRWRAASGASEASSSRGTRPEARGNGQQATIRQNS